MVINIQIQKKDLYFIGAIIIFLVGVGFVIANGGNNPAIHGHSFGEITGSIVGGCTEICGLDAKYRECRDSWGLASCGNGRAPGVACVQDQCLCPAGTNKTTLSYQFTWSNAIPSEGNTLQYGILFLCIKQ